MFFKRTQAATSLSPSGPIAPVGFSTPQMAVLTARFMACVEHVIEMRR